MSSFFFYEPVKGDQRYGHLQKYESVQWLEAFQSPGEVKIVASATPQNRAYLVEGIRVFNSDSDTVARICYKDIVQGDEGPTIEARAILTANRLADRALYGTQITNNFEQGMYDIYSNNRRGMSIKVGKPIGYPESRRTETTGGTVLDAETKLAGLSGFGFKVRFDPETGDETFEVYRGVDRSNEDSDDYVGYFSRDAGIVSNVEVSSGDQDYKNVAVVEGAGVGEKRYRLVVNPGNVSDDDARELPVDARDLQWEYQVAMPTGEYDDKGNEIYSYETRKYTEVEYMAILYARGLERLTEYLKTFSIKCDIDQTHLRYGTDYFLGDRMPIMLKDMGLYASARVASVLFVYESGSGRRVIVSLDDFAIMNNGLEAA